MKIDGIILPAKVVLLLSAFGAVATGQSLSNFTCSPTTIPIGSSMKCTATISSSAPLTGFVIQLSTTATGLTMPTSVKISWGTSVMFTVMTSSSTPAQTAVINAKAGTITKSATVIISGTATYSIASMSCSPATLIPGQTTTCTGSLSAAAPAGGLITYLSSSSPNLPVPASANIVAGGNGFRFTATASLQASVVEQISITARVLTSSVSRTVTINPTPKFFFKGNTQELSLLANGANVQPSVTPSGWLGTLTVRGAGYIAFDPFFGNDGLLFHQNGAQSTNTAFINFSGTNFGTVFNSASEISFLVKSAYSYAERRVLPMPNTRTLFEVFDNSIPWYSFSTYTSSTGQLQFSFGVHGYTAVYTVPFGQEDLIFGRGVVAKIRFTWTTNSYSLYVNDKLVRTSTFTSNSANWSSLSALTIGSRNIRVFNGGYYASDDSLAELMIR